MAHLFVRQVTENLYRSSVCLYSRTVVFA